MALLRFPVKDFLLPLLVFLGILLYSVFSFFHQPLLAQAVIVIATVLGSYQLFVDTFRSVLKKQFALDYIAIMAIILSLYTGEYLVAGILALMISSGATLELYSTKQAKKTLSLLAKRIPTDVTLWEDGVVGRKEKLKNVSIGQEIFVKKGEIIPLDGLLVSESGLTDESSLTGEPYIIDKIASDTLRSGTINAGGPLVMRVTKKEHDSTYRKILDMVEKAQEEKSPFVRLADTYSNVFTIATFSIAGFTYVYSGFNLTHVLSVLAIATPCPLIIATPIALLGGVNAAAKKRIIVKKLASLETLARVNAFIFDKTGTITLGKPQLISLAVYDKAYSEKAILAAACAIERNSLHPLAKAIVQHAKVAKAPVLSATNIRETVGKGISGTVNKKEYTLATLDTTEGMAIGLFEGKRKVAAFFFADEVKQDAKKIIEQFKAHGLSLHIFTGDKKETAEKVAAYLDNDVVVKAQCSPQDKLEGINSLKNQGKVTAMVGDGINDAPALALADVGIVFSSDEQTAASEAADIVILGGDFSLVYHAYVTAKKTISIALQSIRWGIGLSIVGMLFAAFGFIPPIFGAGLQNFIDVAEKLNALRPSRS